MASAKNNTHILCLVVALLAMSTSFLPSHAEVPRGWCTGKGGCEKPVTPENQQACRNYCEGFGFNPQNSYCQTDPDPRCCCVNQ